MSEALTLHEILKAWGKHPRLRIARVNTGAAPMGPSRRLVRFGVPGTADIVGIVKPNGRMIHLECKTLKGRARENQLIMQRIIREFGGVYEFCRSLEDADRVFAALGISRVWALPCGCDANGPSLTCNADGLWHT